MSTSLPLKRYWRSVRHGPTITVWLSYRAPYHWPSMLGFLAARSIAGIEALEVGVYRRTVVMAGRQGVIHCRPVGGQRLALTVSGLPASLLPGLIARVRRVFDLDADPHVIAQQLGRDPLMARLIAARPGLRVPGGWEPFEQVMRTVLGQQISVAAAMTLAGRLVARHGQPLARALIADRQLTHVFPLPQAIADVDLSDLGLPRSRAATLSGMARALLEDPRLLRADADLHTWITRLCRLRGIGPWSAQYLALRQLGAADAFPLGDVALAKALRLLESAEAQLAERALAWRPWRAYAAQHLWAWLAAPQRD
ncbi:DNA-3-methyladenine glycosylase family protein [Pseudomonas sp. BJa5]|uniref:DNA-3-methyladenine glycosylase family protein n=1 Tax=Pseudomonas sp. BJa5 TaxID=2936270 RepID=UPI0025597ECA|nr:AlkA N-terminal domain-containing protein [Pseudomonas sp. BGr12]MDL2419872.1 DNA-3-methyladenine glycosylase 2 family protein [Pseudomonas sp. BGr12]